MISLRRRPDYFVVPAEAGIHERRLKGLRPADGMLCPSLRPKTAAYPERAPGGQSRGWNHERWFILALLPLALAACGNRSELTPPPGQSLPPKPYAAQERPTPEELIQPSTQARPGRSDELLKQSRKREQDEFDLPPPG